jgi:hypothetical protein
MSDSRPQPAPGSDRPGPDSSSGTRPVWITVGVLVAVGAVVPLLVWTYDSESPALGAFPFFYWYQFLLIPIVSGLTFVAFRLSELATERDRAARRASRRNP